MVEALTENLSLADRIDVFEIEQFVALNLYETGRLLPKDAGRLLLILSLDTTKSSTKWRRTPASKSNSRRSHGRRPGPAGEMPVTN